MNYLSDDDETFFFSFLFFFSVFLSSTEDALRIGPSHSRIYSEHTRAVLHIISKCKILLQHNVPILTKISFLISNIILVLSL